MSFGQQLSRSLRLRCPLCGKGKLFRGWFKMHETCSSCGIRYEPEPGFFLGSIYVNYGLTALVPSIAYPILLLNRVVPDSVLQISCLAFVVIFPILFFPYSRSLWLGFDQRWDPRPETDEINSDESDDS